MSKALRIEVVKMIYTDVFIIVPDDFDGDVNRYSKAIRQQADNCSPGESDLRPWKEDRRGFEFDGTPREATQADIRRFGLDELPEETPDY